MLGGIAWRDFCSNQPQWWYIGTVLASPGDEWYRRHACCLRHSSNAAFCNKDDDSSFPDLISQKLIFLLGSTAILETRWRSHRTRTRSYSGTRCSNQRGVRQVWTVLGNQKHCRLWWCTQKSTSERLEEWCGDCHCNTGTYSKFNDLDYILPPKPFHLTTMLTSPFASQQGRLIDHLEQNNTNLKRV